MNKYIDAEKLYKQVDELMAHFAELEKENESDNEYFSNEYFSIFYQGKREMCSELLDIINSLQQEQSDMDLERKVEDFCLEYDARKEIWYGLTPQDQGLLTKPTWVNFAMNIAHHFYELGLNARKDE